MSDGVTTYEYDLVCAELIRVRGERDRVADLAVGLWLRTGLALTLADAASPDAALHRRRSAAGQYDRRRPGLAPTGGRRRGSSGRAGRKNFRNRYSGRLTTVKRPLYFVQTWGEGPCGRLGPRACHRSGPAGNP